MLSPVKFHYPIFDRRLDFDTEELTQLELVGRVAETLNETIDTVNGWQGQLDNHELSNDITNKRKLSAIGDFSGTIQGRSSVQIISDVADSIGLSMELIRSINNRESIGTIYDGGMFLETDPPTYSIEGGLF